MLKLIQKIGTSRGIVLTRDMLQHLGATDAVDIEFDKGCLIITAPKPGSEVPRKRHTVAEALDAVNAQYPDTMRALAE